MVFDGGLLAVPQAAAKDRITFDVRHGPSIPGGCDREGPAFLEMAHRIVCEARARS
jgi:hypothetical protein